MSKWKFFMMCLMVLALVAMPLLACGDDEKDEWDLTIAVDGNGSTSPAAGVHTYEDGTVVDITATADSGWMFESWTGDVADSDSTSTTVTMNKVKTVTANFVQVYTLTMVIDGNGTTDPASGEHEYAAGTVVDITATANTNNSFNNWTGDVDDVTKETTTVTMDSDKTVTAVFTLEVYPSATITSPLEDDIVSGEVTIEATLTDNKSVAMGGFVVDNPQDPENPPIPVTLPSSGPSVDYSYTWDSTTVANGEHILYVLVRDNLNQGAFATVTVMVNNPT